MVSLTISSLPNPCDRWSWFRYSIFYYSRLMTFFMSSSVRHIISLAVHKTKPIRFFGTFVWPYPVHWNWKPVSLFHEMFLCSYIREGYSCWSIEVCVTRLKGIPWAQNRARTETCFFVFILNRSGRTRTICGVSLTYNTRTFRRVMRLNRRTLIDSVPGFWRFSKL